MSQASTAARPARGFVLPRFLRSEHPFPWLAPITAMLLVFGVYPLCYAFWLSLHKRNPATNITDNNMVRYCGLGCCYLTDANPSWEFSSGSKF